MGEGRVGNGNREKEKEDAEEGGERKGGGYL